MRGEADGDAADAETGDQRGDVDPDIVEDDQDRDGEQRDADQHANDANALPTAVSVGSSPALRAITPRISSRAQIAPCSAKAIVNKMSSRRSILHGTAV